MEPSAAFFAQATTGLSGAAVCLLTYIVITLNDINKRLMRHERIVDKVLGRVQRLSTAAQMPELEID